MPLAPGARLGSYEILGRLGAGGMGDVYRARDMKLNRTVALKILPDLFANDPERLARFEREAKTLATLNHPHIAQIHGLEEAAGSVRALVMELVDGEDLAERIARGPIPIDEAIPIALQVAEALEAAHEQGVVHRDLKPANIKIRTDGTAKVLDFGLAKAPDPSWIAANGEALTDSPTITSPAMTRAGVIVGTAAYMSPEQARGKSVDKRADIWAFGVVLYEMLTGRWAFQGDTVPDVIAAVLRGAPDWTALPADTPRSIRRLLRRCLERDPRRRLRDMGDARLEIEEEEDGGREATGGLRTKRTLTPYTLAGLMAAVAAAATFAAWSRLGSPPSNPIVRLTIPLPPGETVTSAPAISRDGSLVAYSAARRFEAPRLFVRRLDESEAHEIPGSTGAENPFFSPDGTEVAFFAQAKVWTALVSGGTPTALADASGLLGGTWGDGVIVFSAFDSGLVRIAASGGPPEVLTRPGDGTAGYAHVWPRFLPGGRDLLFTVWGDEKDTSGVARLSAGTARWEIVRRVPLETGLYVPSGHLLSIDDSSVGRVVPFNPSNPGVTGPEVPVLHDVYYSIDTANPWVGIADNGTLVYARGRPRGKHLVWVDRAGRVTPLSEEPGAYLDASIAPDGTRVLYRDRWEVWLRDLRLGTRKRLIWNPSGPLFRPIWSHDGTHVIFASERSRDWELYSTPVNAPGSWEILLRRRSMQVPASVSPQGVIAFEEVHPVTGMDVWTVAPGGRPTPFRATPFDQGQARFSPDGRLMAYLSDESGRYEVFVQPYPGPGEPIMVSTDGGSDPTWARDGKQLFYRARDTVMAVDIGGERDRLNASSPKRLFTVELQSSLWGIDLDVTPDGKRFLGVQPQKDSEPTQIEVVLNWSEELKAKAPRGKSN